MGRDSGEFYERRLATCGAAVNICERSFTTAARYKYLKDAE